MQKTFRYRAVRPGESRYVGFTVFSHGAAAVQNADLEVAGAVSQRCRFEC